MQAHNRWSRLATASEAVQRRIQSSLWRHYVKEELSVAPAWAERLGDIRELTPDRLPLLTQEDLARLAPRLRPHPNPQSIRAQWSFSRKLSLTLLGKKSAELLRASYSVAQVALVRLPNGATVPIESTGSDLDLLAELGARLVDVHGIAGTLVDCSPADDALWSAVLAPGAARAGLRVHRTGGPRLLDVDETLGRLTQIKPQVLAAPRAFAAQLLDAARSLPTLRALLLLDGPRDPALEERLRSIANADARVCGHLAIPEARLVFPEAEGVGGFALWPDLAMIRIGDPTLDTHGESNELIVSHLRHRGTALLGYRTGITAKRVTWTTWPDGRRTLARLELPAPEPEPPT